MAADGASGAFAASEAAVDTSERRRYEASGDFGRLTRGNSLGVVEPSTVEELRAIIATAIAHDTTLTPRGFGLSQGGQSLAPNGWTLELGRLAAIDAPDAERGTIRVQPGATWRRVVQACAPAGLVPRVLPLNLDLTIGGTLSVGGIGSTSHRFGPAIDSVASLEVIAGTGERIACSPTEQPVVFDAVLGGLGAFGVIAGAELELRRARSTVRTHVLLYDDPATWLRDHQTLIQRVDHVEAYCSASVQGSRGGRPFAVWFYGLRVSIEHDGSPPSDDELLHGLAFYRHVHREDAPLASFAARYDPRFAMMRRSGSWGQAHPWFEVLLPVDVLQAVLPRVLDELPLALGDGHRVFFVAPSAHKFFPRPNGAPVVCFAILPVGIPWYAREEVLTALRRLHADLVGRGGRRYPTGWLDMMDAVQWRDHFGDSFAHWQTCKQTLDPHTIFTSRLLAQIVTRATE